MPQRAGGRSTLTTGDSRNGKPIQHGTERGYKQHWYRKETACDECLEAHAAESLLNSRKRGVQPRKTKSREERIAAIPHGTNRGYNQHLKLEIDTCDECRAAHNAQVLEYRDRPGAREKRKERESKALRYGKVQLPLDIFAQLWFSADDRGLLMLDTYFGKDQVDDWIKMNEEANDGRND